MGVGHEPSKRATLPPFITFPNLRVRQAKEQYDALNYVLTYFGVDDIGFTVTMNLGPSPLARGVRVCVCVSPSP